MKIGYPCINSGIGCTANSTFRLANYSPENLVTKVTNNLTCLQKILDYNVKNNLLFFRISSDLIPFASHPICDAHWQDYFKEHFSELGRFIKKNNVRISMHPDQFVLLNSPKKEVVKKSVADLTWHCEVLDLMGLDNSAKVQIHVGGVYNDKASAIKRFVRNYKKLPQQIKKRLVIENDERLYSVKECLSISEMTNVPILFDSFHHSCLHHGETTRDAFDVIQKTWNKHDGIPMTDYSSQQLHSKVGKHTEHIDIRDFKRFIEGTKGMDFDIMLEIKDKEKSALKAIKAISA